MSDERRNGEVRGEQLIGREADGPALLRNATNALERAGSSTPRLDAELLLAALLGTRMTTLRTAVAAGFPLPLPQVSSLPEPEPLRERHAALAETLQIARAALAAGDAPAALSALVSERANGRPISHLTGTRGFRSLELLVTPDVLDPRPETELVVETALAYLADRVAASRALGRAPQPFNAAEIGTGSGAIAIAVASESPAPLRFVERLQHRGQRQRLAAPVMPPRVPRGHRRAVCDRAVEDRDRPVDELAERVAQELVRAALEDVPDALVREGDDSVAVGLEQ